MKIISKSINYWKTYGFRALLGKVISKYSSSPQSMALQPPEEPVSQADHHDPWHHYAQEAMMLATLCNFSKNDLSSNAEVLTRNKSYLEIKTVMWFLPYIDYAFYGGLYTILRFASYMSEKYDVQNIFTIFGPGNVEDTRKVLEKAFPRLASQEFIYIQSTEEIKTLPASDACISTLWITAYHALRYNQTRRKFYFLQDFEPLFYPAGSTYAQAEESYRFGFFGLANTITLKNIYEEEYHGTAEYFSPAIDQQVFFPNLQKKYLKSQYKVFFYGRPGHPRNGFELGVLALKRLKEIYGPRVEIVTAGSEWSPAQYGLEGYITNLGLLPYEQTGHLYRECDLGLIMMFTRHPSYLPFELMACNCTVISNRNKYTEWLLKDNENCFLAHASVDALAEVMERAIEAPDLREKVNTTALQIIRQNHINWDSEIEKIYLFMQSLNSAK